MSALNYLAYRNYCYSREKHPRLEPENYKLLFPEWEEFEKKYQVERDYWKEIMKIKEHVKNIIFIALLGFNLILIVVILNEVLDALKTNSKQIELIINHLNKKEMEQ
jgi:hypothetical protein